MPELLSCSSHYLEHVHLSAKNLQAYQEAKKHTLKKFNKSSELSVQMESVLEVSI